MRMRKRDIKRIYSKHNPAWADRVLEKNMNLLGSVTESAELLPFLEFDVRNNRVYAKEYGCGVLGCVYPTLRDDIVFKITSDVSEVKFVLTAMNMGEWPEGMVQYTKVVILEGSYRNNPIAGLWREAAIIKSIGILGKKYEAGTMSKQEEFFDDFLSLFFTYAELVERSKKSIKSKQDLDIFYNEVSNSKYNTQVYDIWSKYFDPKNPMKMEDQYDYYIYPQVSAAKEFIQDKVRRISILLSICIKIAKEIQIRTPEFASIGHALEFYGNKYILIGDVHLLNVAQVDRKGKSTWVIIDPGVSLFFTNKFDHLFKDLYV